MPGYWAVEIRQTEAAGAGKRYLCQAQDERSAGAIAARLMGSALSVLGFSHYWIDGAQLDGDVAKLPLLGEHQDVASPAQWADLMAAHDASEVDRAAERGGA